MDPSIFESHLNELSNKLQNFKNLDKDEVLNAGHALISEECPDPAKETFLSSWQRKGETPEEVSVLASLFREKARNPELHDFSERAIDIVGTGGDKAGTFNLSTTTALVVAAAGVPVIKHGNRSITSKTGSADLLESLEVPLQANNSLLRKSIEERNFCFLFAPGFHPAFKAIMPVRKAMAARGEKTVFNILGPLINPAQPKYELMGVFSQQWVDPLAEVLTSLGLKRGLVAHSQIDGQDLDEISALGGTHLSGVGGITESEVNEIQSIIDQGRVGSLHDLKGGDSETNQAIFRAILNNQANEALTATITLNAGIALWIAEKATTVSEGISLTDDLIKSGVFKKWVQETKEFFKNVA
ncbi:MAG: anthranilate phosphoribosyltransferase [Opitutales bacterium]|nr:anthranilate phosphoribosyltransferase [Opitutales bacterium]